MYGRLQGILLQVKNYGQGKGASGEALNDMNILIKKINEGVGKDPVLVREAVESGGPVHEYRG